MNIINMTCDSCAGTGTITNWVLRENDGTETTHTAYRVDEECPHCGGKGYTEYAMFTVEEAKQIMKVCGIQTEIGDF